MFGLIALASLAGLGLALFSPIYADEMGYRLISARYVADGHANIYIFPYCGAPFTTPVPLWMLPFRLLQDVAYAPGMGLLHIRAIGVTLDVLSILATIALIIYRIPSTHRSLQVGAILAFFGLGVLPFATVMDRPDLWIRSAVVLWCLGPALGSQPGDRRVVYQVLSVGLIVLIPAAAIATMHMKAVLFFPVAALAIWRLTRLMSLRVVGLMLLSLIAASAYLYWTARLACPGFPVQNDLFGQAVPPRLLWTDPVKFVTMVAANVFDFPRYWHNILFQENYVSDWLPGAAPGMITSAANLAIRGAFGLILVSWLGGAVYILWSLVRDRRLSYAALLAAVLSGCVLLNAGLSIPKYFIESPLILPVAGLAAWLTVSQLPRSVGRWTSGLLCAVVSIAFLVSQVPLWLSYYPHAEGSWSKSGYAPGQFISFNYSDYETTRRRIHETAALCNIDTRQKLTHPIIDGLTYPALAGSFQPFEILWTGLNWPGTPESQMAFLRSVRSSGAVAACHLLPPTFMPYARHNGDLCCVPAFDTLPTGGP